MFYVKSKHLTRRLLYLFFTCLTFSFSMIHQSLDSAEFDLSQYEKKVYSQNGEDGVIEKIFELIGTSSGYYVEFGVGNGSECNTQYMRTQYGWTGIMMDSCYENTNIPLYKERITAENITSLFQKYQVPAEFDLLSIDIDSNDFYVWNAICQSYRPRVVVIEYNAAHLPHEDKVILYNPEHSWDGTDYFGASILAYYKLGRKYGYSLVYADSQGVNLFFIRDDLLENTDISFKNMNNVMKIFRLFRSGSQGPLVSHARDPHNRPYCKAENLLK